MILGIIPARAGSEGIPGKNMVDLGGRPLLDYTLATAEGCRGLDRVVLSTNIPEAIAWSREHYRRIETPFVRPEHLSTSSSSSVDVVLHTVDFLEQQDGARVETIVLLQPTCPFRRVEELDSAIEHFRKAKVPSLLGVSRVWHHPSDYVRVTPDSDRKFEYVFRDPAWKRRQDFPEVFFITGSLYICTTDYLRTTGGFSDQQSEIFPMSEQTMVDIDSPFDLEIARGLVAVGADTITSARDSKIAQ